MTITRTAAAVAFVLGSWSALFASPPVADQEELARAKALYTSAAYDEALALLNQFDRRAGENAIEVDQYRAFCLLALGRSDDARKVIQEIVELNPAFQPSDTQVSPRLQDAFREVRRRVLPAIVRQSYAEAKADFERKEFEAAGTRFRNVIALLDDSDAKGAAELDDLRMLSNGFLDLINRAAQNAPPPPAPPAQPSQPPPFKPILPVVYDSRDTDVIPPVPISQVVPQWRPSKQETQTYDGTLTLVIDERGDVTSVTLQGNLQPAYGLWLRRAANGWKYRPAIRGGVPVKYRRSIGIHLSPYDPNNPVRQEG
jgi:tetratricopeptide (TPR) repeat protein